ncbi:hypothetical protein WR25_01737 [Diploscapter pachys]|uniref:Major sperm protein n=1 Tax=Diploscapter pachys TaxID=2018661 RepID=A0A2A2LRL1_9BILA|nr:hypothetical protein WR25_01737 [Diploscapter pachys]
MAADKPGDLKIQVEPSEKIIFQSRKLGEEAVSANLNIKNITKEKIYFKVKCTSNEMFRIRPPIGMLKPGGDCQIVCTFNPGKSVPESSKHYFAIYQQKVTDEKKNPRQAWSELKGDPEGMKKVYIEFKKDEEKAEAKDDKKENDDKKEDKDKSKEKDKGEKPTDDKKADDKDREKEKK